VLRRLGHAYIVFEEEGYAELIASKVNPDIVGFPRYGYSIDLVAGHLVDRGEDISLQRLRGGNSNFSMRCLLQSYALRASFIAFLERQFGLEQVSKLILSGSPPTQESYEKLFQASFNRLSEEWRADLLRRYQAIPDADSLATQYRTQTPIRVQNICVEGTDF
jgi:hypothetical protein